MIQCFPYRILKKDSTVPVEKNTQSKCYILYNSINPNANFLSKGNLSIFVLEPLEFNHTEQTRPNVLEVHFYPSARMGSRGIVVAGRAGGRYRYRCSSSLIIIKLSRNDPWGSTSVKFVFGRDGSLIKVLAS